MRRSCQMCKELTDEYARNHSADDEFRNMNPVVVCPVCGCKIRLKGTNLRVLSKHMQSLQAEIMQKLNNKGNYNLDWMSDSDFKILLDKIQDCYSEMFTLI